MKKGIHPELFETTIACACGEVIHTKATKQNIKVEICSKCHPFFTGKQKLIDSAGRVEKFRRRYANVPQKGAKKEKVEKVKKEKAEKG